MNAIIRYYITDRRSARDSILTYIERADAEGVDLIQIREKDLSGRDLYELTKAAVGVVRRARILVNDRADVAVAAGAHGVHLRSHSISPEMIRRIIPFVAVSCHTLEEVAAAQAADLIVFGPVFETPGKGPPTGLETLQKAGTMSAVPLLALGGITSTNARLCMSAGARGIAAIRLFQK